MTGALPEVMAQRIERIVPPDPAWAMNAREHLNHLTKPLGSLGLLESLAEQLATIFHGSVPAAFSKAAYVFAADHGVTAEGVSLYPAEVTGQMIRNFASGGAAINVLCRAHNCDLTVIDVGVNSSLGDLLNIEHRKVRHGSKNFAREAAMSEGELAAALKVGIDAADNAHRNGHTLVGVGEMGIGNTTAASAITALLTGQSAVAVTGKGTGLDEAMRMRKAEVIENAISMHFGENTANVSATLILRHVGGLEIAAMTGFYIAAAAHGIAVLCDGFISTAAAAIAVSLAPQVRTNLFAGHRSEEPGHRYLLDLLQLQPILQLNMRLGEGTGAVLAMPILESAAALYLQMATFASAGVSQAQ